MSTPFGALKQVDAGPLSVGYAEAGPADGRAVLLLHGWPYDIYSFAEATPLLAVGGLPGHRPVRPRLRDHPVPVGRHAPERPAGGPGDGCHRADGCARYRQAILAGFDWGARSADIVAALWPERCTALISVSGYLIGSQAAGEAPLPPQAELAWWYQYYFATERGRVGYDKYRRDFSKLIWQLASPKWTFDDATFARTAAAFDNPDHVAIVIHNYRWRLSLAAGESQYDDLERQLALPGHRRAHHHSRGRRQRRAAPGRHRLRQQIHRQVPAPGRRGRHRTQSAARSSAGFRQSYHRRRQVLTIEDHAADGLTTFNPGNV